MKNSCVVIQDKNLKPENIKKGVTILKVKGTLESGAEPVLEENVILDPSTNVQVRYPSAGYDGLADVQVNPVTASIDANIQAGNIKKDVEILGVTGTFGGGGGGTDWVLRARAGELTDLSEYSLGMLPGSERGCQYIFYSIPTITKAPQLDPSLSYIGPAGLSMAFTDCTSLTTIPDFSNITSIEELGLYEAFRNCTSLTSVDLSNLTSVGDQGLSRAFSGCTSLTSVDLSNLTSVGDQGLSEAFARCTSLTSVDLSNLTSVGNDGLNNAFAGCTSLTSVDLSNLTYIEMSGLNSAFTRCTSLTSVDLSNLTSVEMFGLTTAFMNCSSLNEIWVGWSEWPSDDYTLYFWVSGVSATGTFHCPPGLAEIFDDSHIPTGWTVVHDVTPEE